MREKFHLRMRIAILEHKLKTCSNNDILIFLINTKLIL